MKTAHITKIIALGLLTLSVVSPAGSCARPAPSPAPAAKPASPSPATAPVPGADALAQIIEGAKKEGSVTVVLVAGYTDTDVIARLRSNIREKYGVNLDIKVVPTRGMSQQVATAIAEYQTGITPSNDLMLIATAYVPAGMKAGVFERVDWKPLVEKGTPPEVIPAHPDLRGGIIVGSNTRSLTYNPQKVSAAEVPKKLSDLADPKWRGRIGIDNYPADWAKWAFILGKEKTLATLRAILKNQALVASSVDLNNRYLIGEVDMAFLAATYLLSNRAKGMPTVLQNLELIDIKEYDILVRSRAPHPNAAKLLAIYLAGPDGMKFSVEVAEKGSHYYPGNYVYDSVAEDRKKGVPVYTADNYPGLMDFMLSPQEAEWEKEIDLILKGA